MIYCFDLMTEVLPLPLSTTTAYTTNLCNPEPLCSICMFFVPWLIETPV
jgi:hypothetical protein